MRKGDEKALQPSLSPVRKTRQQKEKTEVTHSVEVDVVSREFSKSALLLRACS